MKKKSEQMLPSIYADYIDYCQKCNKVENRPLKLIRKVIWDFHNHLKTASIELHKLDIKQVDEYLAELAIMYKTHTVRCYRSILRGFLRYVYYERQILSKDLAQLVKGRREYSMTKPPKFLRPNEIQKLFACLKTSSPGDIRTYAIVHLAYTLGLRNQEIRQIRLDDISFKNQLLTIKTRKGNNPFEIPIPDHTLKAIVAYIIGGRPQSSHRTLFLTMQRPYRPMCANTVGVCIKKVMAMAGLSSTAHWLRHTYAQNLLEAGTTIYEIKEMLGHDHIESTKIYLHVHVKLMRKVLFDETL